MNSAENPEAAAISVPAFQQRIGELYQTNDVKRGIDGTFMWFVEEVGELATALRTGDAAEQEGEFADCIAWLCSLANIAGIDLNKALHEKYVITCPPSDGTEKP